MWRILFRSDILQTSDILKRLESKNVGEILIDEPMKKHTSFKIGGPVDIMLLPKNEEQVVNGVSFCREHKIPYFIMGNGTNLLVRDGGIRGVVIKINRGFNKIEIDGGKIYSQAGAPLTVVSRKAKDNSLTGMEFANGIPGTIGGAVTMNAGAYGGEMKDIISKVRVLEPDNQIKELSNEEMDFRYRGSKVIDEELIVLSVELQLKYGDKEKIEETMRDLNHRRTSKQPLDLPSGGSTFKRPTGYYAGKLIDDSGLRGLRHGGAQVSEKHCGFVVNVDNATCKEVLDLISVIKKTVKDKFGVDLEMEIKVIGEEA